MEEKVIVRVDPRMSTTALAHFVVAQRTASRERIVAKEKIVLKPPVVMYGKARAAMRESLVLAKDPLNYLKLAATIVKESDSKNDWGKRANVCSSEAIEHFAEFIKQFKRRGLLFAAPRKTGYPMTIERVAVSCFPVALIGRKNADGTQSTGALFAIRKKGKGNDRVGAVAAQIVRRALARNGFKSVARELCIVLDVFNEATYTAPKGHRQIDEDIEAACRVIAALWPTIQAKTETETRMTVVREIPLRSPEVPAIPRSAS